ncbi:MAG: hypothetical protein JNK66_00075 [Chitinophagales bacterium]|nr:hypothetical protein [Chitinophagales bacterium]
MNHTNENKKKLPESIHYLTLRQLLGWLGILLPIILAAWSLFGACGEVQESISAYYYTPLRNVFIGILCSIALFLVSYTGYPKEPNERVSENVLTNIAGFLALGVAFFPTKFSETWIDTCHTCSYKSVFPEAFRYIHYCSAVLFFALLAFISHEKFTIYKGPLTEKRIKLHGVYRACGKAIVISIIIIIIYFLLEQFKIADAQKYPILNQCPPIFIFETIALWAFGSSWLIKGKAHIWLTYGWRIAKHKVSKAP